MFPLKWKSVPAWHSPFGARCVYGYMAQDALGSERRKQCMCGRRNLPRIFFCLCVWRSERVVSVLGHKL